MSTTPAAAPVWAAAYSVLGLNHSNSIHLQYVSQSDDTQYTSVS